MVSFSGSQCLPLNAKRTLQIFMIERTMYAIHLASQLPIKLILNVQTESKLSMFTFHHNQLDILFFNLQLFVLE